jgi:hypothetical protein
VSWHGENFDNIFPIDFPRPPISDELRFKKREKKYFEKIMKHGLKDEQPELLATLLWMHE